MKYIIDVPDTQEITYYTEQKMVCLKVNEGIVASEIYIDAEQYTEPDRKAIEDEVWELARRIICPSDCCVDSISAHTKEIFNKEGWEIRGIFNDLSYQEAKSKYESWLKQNDEIHVGDEVKFDIGNNNDMKGIALDQTGLNGEWSVLTENGCVEEHDEEDLHKTGRHFPEVAELLEKMRE